MVSATGERRKEGIFNAEHQSTDLARKSCESYKNITLFSSAVQLNIQSTSRNNSLQIRLQKNFM